MNLPPVVRPKPLTGSRVVLTRPTGQNQAWQVALQAAGSQVLVEPLLRIAPPADAKPLQQALANIENFHWLIVTSPNGARAVGRLLSSREGDPQGWQRPRADQGGAGQLWRFDTRVCAVGRGTAAVLADYNLPVHLIPPQPLGAAIPGALVRQLQAEGSRGLAGQKLLLPQSDRANPALAQTLRKKGAQVTAVPAYRTVTDQGGAQRVVKHLAGGPAAVVVFASPSAVQSFLTAAKQAVSQGQRHFPAGTMAVVHIGPVTAAAWQQQAKFLAVPPQLIVTAAQPTAPSIVQACGRAWRALAPAGPSNEGGM